MIRPAALLALALLLGLAPVRTPTAAEGSGASALIVTGTIDAPLAEAPADIGLALAALVLYLRGERTLSPVTIDADTVIAGNWDGFRHEGFDALTVSLDVIAPSASGRPGRRLGGSLLFAAADGRRSLVDFLIDYRRTDDLRLAVDHLHLRQGLPLVPDFRFALLPADRVGPGFLDGAKDLSDILAAIDAVALDAESLKAGARTRDLVIATLCLERLPPGMGLRIGAGNALGTVEPLAARQTGIDSRGWRLALGRLRVTLDPLAGFYLGAYLDPAAPDSRPSARETLVALARAH